MKKLLIAAAALGAIIAAPAAAQNRDRGGDRNRDGDRDVVSVTQSDTARPVIVRDGQRLVVSVQACVGCPYAWALTRLPTNLALTGISEVSRPNRPGQPPIVGGSKTVEFHFSVLSRGTGALELRNRSFVRGNRDGQSARYNVVTR